jgi:hypothetical protein
MTDLPAQGGGSPIPPVPAHESPLERAEGWFRDHEPQIRAAAKDGTGIAEELKPVLRGHFAGVLALAQRVIADPSLRALEPDVLVLAEDALRITGLAL